MKRILFVLLVVVALLAACAPAAQPTPAPAPTAPPAQPTTAPAPAPTTAPAPAPTAAAPAPTAAAPAPTTAAKPAPSGDPIVIGAVVGLTGFMEALDGSALHMLEFFADEVNAAGGLLGRPLKIVSADMKSDPAIAGTAAVEVIGKGAQILMVPCDFDMGSPAALVAGEKGLVSCSSCASSTSYDIKGVGPLAFTMATAVNTQAAIQAEFAYKQGWRKAWILLGEDVDFDKKNDIYFQERWKELGGKIVGKDTFMNADASIASQITRLKALAEQPDVLAIFSYPPGAAAALRQIRAAGIETPIVTSESWDGDYWLEAVPNLSNFYTLGYASIYGDGPDQKVNELLKKFETKYGKRVDTSHGLTGYAVGQALVEAIKVAGSTDGQKVKAALEKFNKFPSIVGPTTFTEKTHMTGDRKMTILQVTNGKPKFLADFTPAKVPAAQ